MNIGRWYNNIVKIGLAAIAGFAFIDGVSSSIDFLNFRVSLILSLCCLVIYVLLYVIQLKTIANFKGNSKTVNLGTIGILLSFWVPLLFQQKNIQEQIPQSSVNEEAYLSVKPKFHSKSDSHLNILIRPFESQQNCRAKTISFEKALQNCLLDLSSNLSLPLRIAILECDPDRSVIFDESLLNEYSSSEKRIIHDYELGLLHNADVVIDGNQHLNKSDSLQSEIKIYDIDYTHFDHTIYSMSHDNASGLTNQYDIHLLNEFQKYTGDSTLSIGFLSKDVFVHASTVFIKKNKLIGNSYFEVENKLCRNDNWTRIVLSHLIKKLIESGREFEASNIYRRLLERSEDYEMLYGDRLFSTWLLQNTEERLSENDATISSLVDRWTNGDTKSVLSMNLRIIKLRLLFKNPKAGNVIDYINSLKESASKSRENLLTYILAKYITMYYMKHSDFTNHEILKFADDDIKYNDVYGTFERFTDNSIDINSLKINDSFFRLDVFVALLNGDADFSQLSNKIIE